MKSPRESQSVSVSRIYAARFTDTGLEKRTRVWKVLCSSFFQELVQEDSAILDLACGYGEFINNINAREKLAVDLNPDSEKYLNRDVTFFNTPATDLRQIPNSSVDTVFTSNFLEHLPTKKDCTRVLQNVFNVLRPSGTFIVLGPNIRYAYAEY